MSIFNVVRTIKYSGSFIVLIYILFGCDSGVDHSEVNFNRLKLSDDGQESNSAYTAIVLSNDQHQLIVADAAKNQLHFFDIANSDEKYIRSQNLPDVPKQLIFCENQARIFVSFENSNIIYTYKLDSDAADNVLLEVPQNVTSIAADSSNNKLYVGAVDDQPDSIPAIYVYDIAEINNNAIVFLGNLPTDHAYIVGMSNHTSLLLTSTYQVNAPNVSLWDLSSIDSDSIDFVMPILTDKLFGGSVNINAPGQAVFSPDDRRFYLLTEGSSANDANMPVYEYDTENKLYVEPNEQYRFDYRTIALAYNRSADRIIVAHDNKDPVNPSGHENNGHLYATSDLHVYVVESREEVTTSPIKIPDINNSTSYVSPDGLVVSSDNTIYALLYSGITGDKAHSILSIRID